MKEKNIPSPASVEENPAEQGFELHAQLASDTYCVGKLPLSLVLLSKDANYPWLILVPRRADICELTDLCPDDQTQLFKEQILLLGLLRNLFVADKMNMAALGNMVPQLHVHIVARFKHDAAWPKPIWGQVSALNYSSEQLENRLESLRLGLAEAGVDFLI